MTPLKVVIKCYDLSKKWAISAYEIKPLNVILQAVKSKDKWLCKKTVNRVK